MIRSIGLALVLSLLIFSSAEAKIGAAPFNQVIQESEMGKAAKTLMDSKFGKEQKALEGEYVGFQKEAQAFEKQAKALSEKARMQKAQELDRKARTIDAKRNAMGQKAAPIQQKLNETIFKIAYEATENVAKANKLDMIVDTSPPVYYISKSINVAEDILKEINKLWKQQGSKFNI